MICPLCKELLSKIDKSYKCKNNHSFDIAKEGYVNLLISKVNSGDNKSSVNARDNFLSKGYYDFLGEEISTIISSKTSNLTVLDLGCGTGYYDKFIKANNLYGLDISKDAIIKASKHNKNYMYIVQSSANIPFKDNYFDIVFTIFAPIFIDEVTRVLKKNGIFIVVTPGINHLFELKEIMYSNPYHNEVKISHYPGYDVQTKLISKKVSIDHESIFDLIKMTPYYYKTNIDDINNIKNDSLDVTFEFLVNIYTPKIEI